MAYSLDHRCKPPIRWAVAGLSFLLFLVHQVRYVQNITLLVEPSDRQLLSERQAKEQLASAHE